MPPLGTSPCSRPALAGWDCRRPRAPARRPIGWPGPMPSVCSANGARPSRTGRSAASLTLVDQPAYGQLLKHELLVVGGWADVPSWELVEQGARPPDRPDAIAEPGEWRHGWQHCASRARSLFFCGHVLLPSLPPSHRALLRSQAGSHAAAWLQAIPSDPHTSLTLRQCRSRCAAGSGSNSRSHPAAAGALRNLVAAAVRMLVEIMHLHALAPTSWQSGPNLSSESRASLVQGCSRSRGA